LCCLKKLERNIKPFVFEITALESHEACGMAGKTQCTNIDSRIGGQYRAD